ncbi:BnaC01g37410D [Brassica napus]|uniref:BnaC01g37410D protein n=1 Tax=Brassica napus TaxID=3708 RepID=A0A078HIC4_BRANA|nr:BnaC01g37410D [Brassica napus]
MTTMSDLPQDLTKEIFSRVPLTSLSAVRSTCKSWNSISNVCSMKFDLQGIQNEADFVDPSIKQRQVKALDVESLFGANKVYSTKKHFPKWRPICSWI